jgi:type I restriction enzyme S subunit
MDTPFWTVDTLFYSEISEDNNAKFLYYRFCLINWIQYNEASGVPSLNARTIENIEIDCPELAEQIAIATILSDVDAELTALEARRDKTRAETGHDAGTAHWQDKTAMIKCAKTFVFPQGAIYP